MALAAAFVFLAWSLTEGLLAGWRAGLCLGLGLVLALAGGCALVRPGVLPRPRFLDGRAPALAWALAGALCLVHWVVADEGLARRVLLLAALAAAPGVILLARPSLQRAEPPRVLILACAALVGLGFWARLLQVVAHPLPIAGEDTGTFLAAAYQLAFAGDFPVPPIRTPGYSAFYGVVLACGGQLGARLVPALAGPALALLLGGWLWRRVSPGAGALFAAYLLVDPTLLAQESLALSEWFAAATSLLGLAAVIIGATPAGGDLRWFGAGGCCLGVSVLTRPNGLAAVAVLALAIAVFQRASWRRAVAAGGALLGPALLGLVAWSLRNLAIHGVFASSTLLGPHLFAASAHFIDLDGGDQPEVKQRLRAPVAAFRRADDPEAIDALLWGPAGAWAALDPLTPFEKNRVCTALAREAILSDPGAYLAGVARRSRRYLLPQFVVLSPRGSQYADYALFHADQRARWQSLGAEFPPAARPGLDAALQAAAPTTWRAFAWTWADRALHLFAPALGLLGMGAPFLALAALGLRRRREVLLPALFAWAILLSVPLFHKAKGRYRTPVVPVCLLAVALALPRPRAASEDGP